MKETNPEKDEDEARSSGNQEEEPQVVTQSFSLSLEDGQGQTIGEIISRWQQCEGSLSFHVQACVSAVKELSRKDE